MPTLDQLLEKPKAKEGYTLDDLVGQKPLAPTIEPINVYAGIADPQDVEVRAKDVLKLARENELPIRAVEENYDEINKQTSEFDPNEFDNFGIVEEKEKPGLLKRIGMSFLRKTFIEPLIAIETKSKALGGFGILMEIDNLLHEFEGQPTPEEYKELARLGKAIYVDKIYRKYSFLNVPPPETITEKGVELGTGLGAFITQLAVAKKILGPGGTGRDVVAWEMVNLAEGGPLGKGVVMRLAFAGIDKVPTRTVVGGVFKLTAQGTTLASATAIAGGTKEDIAVAFLIPFALKAIRATKQKAVKVTRTALENRTIKHMRTLVDDRGYDLSGVPDDALREIIRTAKVGNWWAKQFKKGKISEVIYDKRLGQLQERIKPIIQAIAKQQPEKDIMIKYQRRIIDRIERGGPTTGVDVKAIIAQGQIELDQVLLGKAPPVAPITMPPTEAEEPPSKPIQPSKPEIRPTELEKAEPPTGEAIAPVEPTVEIEKPAKVKVKKELVLSADKDTADIFVPKVIPTEPDKVTGLSFQKYWKKPGDFLKRFARTIPEFTVEPVFTVESEKTEHIETIEGKAQKVIKEHKRLVWKQFGETFRLEPSVFGIDPAQLTEGQKIRIDFTSYDIKIASKAALKKAGKLPFIELPSEQIAKGKPIDIDHRDAGFVEIPPITTVGKIEAEHPNIRIVAPKKDISALQKWVLTSTNQAQNTGHPTIIKAANTMADIGMVMQNEIRSQLAADGEIYKQLPKEYRADKGRKFFELMDKHYSPEEIDIAEDVPDEVKPVLKHFKLQDEAMRQEIIKQKRTMMKAIFQRKSLPELQKLAAEKDIQITKPGVTKTINRTKAELARDLAVEEVGDDWGRQWSHIQHIFFGRYELQFIDSEGNPHFIGKAQTQTEAYQKLADWKAARTAAGFDDADKVKLIATPELHIPFDVMRISRKHFYTLESQIQEAANLQRDEIQDALRGIIGKRESKQKWWGSLMYRKGAPGYSQEFMKVWMVQTAQFNRWKHLSEMNRKVTPLIDQIRSEGLRGWAQYLEDTKDFLWGKKRSDVGRELDVFLSKIPVVKNYIKPFAFERWAGLIKSINYWRHLQTGRFYAVNTMQLAQTLWPVVGEKGLYQGIKLYYSKEGQELLRKYKIAGTSGKLHEIGMKRTRQFERYTPAGASELRNQGIAFLALYDDGIKRGMSESEAASYARLRGQLFTQFSYTPSDIPQMMRGPIGGLVFQYKRFTIKNLELVSRMAREGKWGGVTRWLAALISIGGLSTFLKVLPTGLAGYLTYSIYKKIKDEYGKETADVIHHGLPGLVGVDLSGSVTPIDVPYGENIYEKVGNIVLGPTGQTAQRLFSDIRELKVTKEIGLVPRALKSFVDSSPTVKQFVYLAKALEKDTTNYDRKQRMMYELEVWDLWKKAFGFRAESETLQRMQFEAMMDLKVEYDETIDHIILATMERDFDNAIKHINDWQSKFPEAPISAESVIRRLKERGMARTLPMTDRAFKELPAPLKAIFAGEKKTIEK